MEKKEISLAVISIDFDGSCVTHEYPEIGYEIGAVEVLRELVEVGHKLILNTMRSNWTLTQAVLWFEMHKIPLYGIQMNPTQKSWTDSTKVHADYYIDDAAIGCPLKYDKSLSGSNYIDWVKMREYLVKLDLLR